MTESIEAHEPEPKRSNSLGDMHPFFKCIFLVALMVAFVGTMCWSLNYYARSYKPKPEWVKAQNKICHETCAALWEIGR